MYLLDANTYINAKNFHYGMDFCPAYWDWLDQQFALGNLASVEMVYSELAKYGDELSLWVKDRKDHFLLVTDSATQNKYIEVITHISGLPNKNQSNVANFFDGADPWLIAKAVCLGATVVTHESLVPDSSTKIKIPNICKDFNVQYINSFELLRILNAQFRL